MITRLNTIRSCADELHRQGHGELTVPPATKRIFESYYERYYVRCSNETLGANLIARIQTYLWKFCLLFAACDLSAEIRPEHIDRAIIIADFLERSMLYVFHGFGGDPKQADEAELLRYLRGKGQVSNRDVYSGLHLHRRRADLADDCAHPNRVERAQSYAVRKGEIKGLYSPCRWFWHR
ncbi:MAG: hypothetical protein PHV74_11700 [Dehalococcoidia bacterium]|nr:hypothetical protein [Dehalococcoidia bacterium]